MAASTWLMPGGPVVVENQDGAAWLVPSAAVVKEEAGAPPAGVAPTGALYGPLVGPLGGPI